MKNSNTNSLQNISNFIIYLNKNLQQTLLNPPSADAPEKCSKRDNNIGNDNISKIFIFKLSIELDENLSVNKVSVLRRIRIYIYLHNNIS